MHEETKEVGEGRMVEVGVDVNSSSVCTYEADQQLAMMGWMDGWR